VLDLRFLYAQVMLRLILDNNIGAVESSRMLAVWGRSAGGLTLGASLNMDPEVSL
jgi:prolyl oligopeptidase PreP (S9A serine peptidase family)